MLPKGKNPSTGGDKRILTPLNQLQDMMYKTQQSQADWVQLKYVINLSKKDNSRPLYLVWQTKFNFDG